MTVHTTLRAQSTDRSPVLRKLFSPRPNDVGTETITKVREVRRLHTFLFVAAAMLTACGSNVSAQGSGSSPEARVPNPEPATTSGVRRGFLGAFFRPVGPPPFGVFSVYSKQRAPDPYPSPRTTLFGPSGYCDALAANGLSISTGYLVDATKLRNIVDLGVKWTRTAVSPNYADQSHIMGPGKYTWSDLDSAQCALARHHIIPVVGVEAGTVQYNRVPDQYSPAALPNYKTAADFGGFCSVLAQHESRTFTAVSRYSIPGNEVNSTPATWPGGEAQIAAFTQACYRAIKAVQPNAVVYGFELNMDKNRDGPAFVQRMYDLGCKVRTCYDALSIHMFLSYPLPDARQPCYPTYSFQCISAIQTAAHAPTLHVLIGETAYMIPSTVRDEATKAKAVVDAIRAFASYKFVDGVSYANVDECDLYPNGYFFGGCLVDSVGTKLPAYAALQALAKTAF